VELLGYQGRQRIRLFTYSMGYLQKLAQASPNKHHMFCLCLCSNRVLERRHFLYVLDATFPPPHTLPKVFSNPVPCEAKHLKIPLNCYSLFEMDALIS
jgi:hypothetical protein